MSVAGTDVTATGHAELSANLPGYCDFVSEVLNTLVANAAGIAEQLRIAARDYCSTDEASFDSFARLSSPTFHAQGSVPQ